MREEFEKLPTIAKYLEFVFWNDETKGYCNNGDNVMPLDFASFLNGALYAYQEKQTQYSELESLYHQQGLNVLEMNKKIDSVIRLLDEKSMYHKTSGDRFVFSKDVGELLK